MTTYDPEDEAERRRVGGCCRNPCRPRDEGVGAKIRQRRPSAREPAAEFGAIKFKVVAKHIKQRRFGLGCNRPRFTIDLQLNGHVLGASLLAGASLPLMA